MNDTSALLQQLGFGEYEAKAYLALVQRSPLNGYEVAKASGIPRANVYSVLQKLEERGVIIRLDTPESARFVPVPPAELTQRLAHAFQTALEAAKQALEEIASPVDREYIWNARGYPALLDHARSLLENARERLQVAISPRRRWPWPGSSGRPRPGASS
jgi:sugar-specific transcriptional regulator TrmB